MDPRAVDGTGGLLAWRKRIWRCPKPACGVRTWTERTAAICPWAVLTERALFGLLARSRPLLTARFRLASLQESRPRSRRAVVPEVFGVQVW